MFQNLTASTSQSTDGRCNLSYF